MQEKINRPKAGEYYENDFNRIVEIKKVCNIVGGEIITYREIATSSIFNCPSNEFPCSRKIPKEQLAIKLIPVLIKMIDDVRSKVKENSMEVDKIKVKWCNNYIRISRLTQWMGKRIWRFTDEKRQEIMDCEHEEC